jgi:hypothetical protein
MDLDNFIIGKTKERRGEGRVGKIGSSCLPKRREEGVKIGSCCKHRSSRRGEGVKKGSYHTEACTSNRI